MRPKLCYSQTIYLYYWYSIIKEKVYIEEFIEKEQSL